MIKIQIVEDDVQMNNALKIYFEKAGYTVFQAFNYIDAERDLKKEDIDIVIADIALPGQSGLELAKKIKKDKNIPFVFLTAKDEEQDILDGYDVGCEEYITKPISPKVLHRKIETILKRKEDRCNILLYKELKIDYEKRRVWKNDIEIRLTSKEWKILKMLAANKGKIITKEVLLDKIWDIEGNFVDDHVVKVLINRLRKKIEENAGNPIYIKNVFGVGYTFGE